MHLVATFHCAVKSLSGKGDISHHIYRHRRQEVLAGRGRASRVRRGGGKAVVQQCRKHSRYEPVDVAASGGRKPVSVHPRACLSGKQRVPLTALSELTLL